IPRASTERSRTRRRPSTPGTTSERRPRRSRRSPPRSRSRRRSKPPSSSARRREEADVRYLQRKPRRVLPIVAALAALVVAVPAAAGTNFGVRTGVYADAGAGFVGAEAVTSIAHAWYFNPNLEYAFTNNDRDVATVNGDFHYDFILDRPYYVWAGA